MLVLKEPAAKSLYAYIVTVKKALNNMKKRDNSKDQIQIIDMLNIAPAGA